MPVALRPDHSLISPAAALRHTRSVAPIRIWTESLESGLDSLRRFALPHLRSPSRYPAGGGCPGPRGGRLCGTGPWQCRKRSGRRPGLSLARSASAGVSEAESRIEIFLLWIWDESCGIADILRLSCAGESLIGAMVNFFLPIFFRYSPNNFHQVFGGPPCVAPHINSVLWKGNLGGSTD